MDQQWIYHNSHEEKYRFPFGAVTCNTQVTLAIEVKKPIDQVVLRLWINNRELQMAMELKEVMENKRLYIQTIQAPRQPQQMWYYFIVYAEGRKFYYGNVSNYGGIGALEEQEPPSYQITVYKVGFETPKWFREGVMYQIFVDRFYNGDQNQGILNKKANKYIYHYPGWEQGVQPYRKDPVTGQILGYDIYGGNLLGIIKKLPYLRELGITILYLNPIFESPSNHKYDIGDYLKVDPMFGTNETFTELCQKSKELGISIILDGVFSHTGSDSIYFNKEGNYGSLGAYQSNLSPYYSWYNFDAPDSYQCWWGIETLPNVNEMEDSYRSFIIHDENSVLKYWLRMGAKGWRLDVADELPDEFIQELRAALKTTDQEAVLIGEVWEDASRKVSYGGLRQYLLGEELDSVMNYPFRNILLDYIKGGINSLEANHRLMALYENYPEPNFYANMNLIGSHDVPRILTLLGDSPHLEGQLSLKQRELAIKRLKLLALIQMTFPGVPCIYYGDEVGMVGSEDPFNRGPFPWGREEQEILNWYKELISIRNKYEVFKKGYWRPLYLRPEVFGFFRLNNRGDSYAITLVNRSTTDSFDVQLNLPEPFHQKKLFCLLEGNCLRVEGDTLSINVKPLGGKLLIIKD